MNNPGSTGIIIVAAGESSRMGIDKIFMILGKKPLLAWPVDVCQRCDRIDQIVIVLNINTIAQGEDLVKKYGWSKVADVCAGGVRRQDSVKKGLQRLRGCDWILIHDGARPFLTEELITGGLAAAEETGAAAAAVPVKDTIKIAGKDKIVKSTPPRDGLWAVQTPQVFRSDIIAKAYLNAAEDVTDDASLAERSGITVKLYKGSYSNIKITTADDIAFAESITRRLEKP